MFRYINGNIQKAGKACMILMIILMKNTLNFVHLKEKQRQHQNEEKKKKNDRWKTIR